VEKRRSEPPRYANVNVFDQTATNFSVVWKQSVVGCSSSRL
jgi:hypothetical protein